MIRMSLSYVLLALLSVSHSVKGQGKLEEFYRWKQIAYEDVEGTTDTVAPIIFPDGKNIRNSTQYIAYNNVPMGMDYYKGRMFITMPRRRPGVPSTLNYVDVKDLGRLNRNKSPKLKSYPNLAMNSLSPNLAPDPNRIISVYRTRIDHCNRLWFVDTGRLEYPDNHIQVQQPSIWVIDLHTNQPIRRFEFPTTIIDLGHGVASITVDSDPGQCEDAYAYMPDLLDAHIYVYSWRQNRVWEFSHNYFNMDPHHGDFHLPGIPEYQWDDNIFSITLSNPGPDGFKTALFHPMVSISEFMVSTRVLRNETASQRSNHGQDFQLLGYRGPNTQSAMHDFDRNTGVVFYSEIARNAVGCWNSNRQFVPEMHAILAQNNETMIYPSDLKVDTEGNLWVFTNSMPRFIYTSLDPNQFNFRIWHANVRDIIQGTVCAL